MANINKLLEAPPYAVAHGIKRLGENLRTARIRRRLKIEEVAQKIGTGVRAVMDAEKGKPSTAIGIYVALLWAYDLLQPLEDVANPAKDESGLAYDAARAPFRVRSAGGLDNDF